MSNRYVKVTITRQTKAISQAGFGLSLILSGDKEAGYKEYTGIEGIGTDYGAESETYKLAAAIFGQSPKPEKVAVFGVDYDTNGAPASVPSDLTTALNELIKSHNDFFFLHCTEQTDLVVTALANWIDTQDKLYFASTTNKALFETLQSANTVLLVHENPASYPAAAWVGACSAQEIGSYTWTFKTLNGIVPATYDVTELDQIEEGASSYISEGGVNITSKGITTTGEYIDIIQGEYYLKARMAEAVFGMMARLPKLPYMQDGVNMLVAEVEGVLNRAATQGVIARDLDGNALYTINIPNVNDIPTDTKAARLLPDVKWSATIAGAIEGAEIEGVLQV